MSLDMADPSDYPGMEEVANAIRDDSMGDAPSHATAHKRKREASDQDGSADDVRRTNSKRVSPGLNKATNGNDDPSGASFIDNQQDADAALEGLHNYNNLHHHAGSGPHNGSSDHAHAHATSTAAAALEMYPNVPAMTIPQPTEVSFASQADSDRNQDNSFNMGDTSQHNSSFMDQSGSGNQQGLASRSSGKPAVGSEEWHKVRKDNHKEGKSSFYPELKFLANDQTVERRRRETINEGINELAKIVPGCEKNKGSILQRAVNFIVQLKDNEAQNIEKWTLEKLLTEQAIAELSATNDKLKSELERAWRQVDMWKKTYEAAGLPPPKKEVGGSPGDDN